MSSRITSPFGSLGDRVAATAAAEARRHEDAPETADDDAAVAEERFVGRGRWVEYRAEDGTWYPGLLVAWRRYHDGGAWWARVVVVQEPGVADEVLLLGELVRPLTMARPGGED